MTKPQIHIHDATTGETIVRDMTEDEYSALLESGLTPGDENNDAEQPA